MFSFFFFLFFLFLFFLHFSLFFHFSFVSSSISFPPSFFVFNFFFCVFSFFLFSEKMTIFFCVNSLFGSRWTGRLGVAHFEGDPLSLVFHLTCFFFPFFASSGNFTSFFLAWRESWDLVGHQLGRERDSTPQSGVEAPRLFKRNLSRLYYCCMLYVVCCMLLLLFFWRLCGSSDPYRVLSLWWSNFHDLHRERSQRRQFLVMRSPVLGTWPYHQTTRHGHTHPCRCQRHTGRLVNFGWSNTSRNGHVRRDSVGVTVWENVFFSLSSSTFDLSTVSPS